MDFQPLAKSGVAVFPHLHQEQEILGNLQAAQSLSASLPGAVMYK